MNLLSVAAIKYHLLQVLLFDECCYVHTTSMCSILIYIYIFLRLDVIFQASGSGKRAIMQRFANRQMYFLLICESLKCL